MAREVVASSRNGSSSRAPEIALDAVTFLLFAAFVALLVLGYLGRYPSVPFSALGAVALAGSLAVLFAANWRANRKLSEPTLATVP